MMWSLVAKSVKCFLDRPAISQSIAQCAVRYSKFVRPFFEAQSVPVVSEHLSHALLGWCRWRGQRLFDSPVVQSHPQCAVGYTKSLSPIEHAERLSFVGDHPCLTAVLRLLFLACPATVFRGVWSISVWVSVNRGDWKWLLPHVFQEVQKGLSPPIANYYSSSTIKLVVSCIRIVAASFHCAPNAIFRRARLALHCLARRRRCVAFIHRNHLCLLHKGRVFPFRHGKPALWLGRMFQRLERMYQRPQPQLMRRETVRYARRTGRLVHKARVQSVCAVHRDVRSFVFPSIFRLCGKLSRLTRRHDSTPQKLDYCESRIGPPRPPRLVSLCHAA